MAIKIKANYNKATDEKDLRQRNSVDEFTAAIMMLHHGGSYLSSKLMEMAEATEKRNDEKHVEEINSMHKTLLRTLTIASQYMTGDLKIPKGSKGKRQLQRWHHTVTKSMENIFDMVMEDFGDRRDQAQDNMIDYITDAVTLYLNREDNEVLPAIHVKDPQGSTLREDKEGNMKKFRTEH